VSQPICCFCAIDPRYDQLNSILRTSAWVDALAVQEYTLIKMRVLELKGKLAGLEGQGPVFLMAATLRFACHPGCMPPSL